MEITFNWVNAEFAKAEGEDWTLVRDWVQHPPNQREIECLFAYARITSGLLHRFMGHFVAGNLQIVEGLDKATDDRLTQWIAEVGAVMCPPAERRE